MPENAAHARERYAGKCNARAYCYTKLGRYAVACLPLVLGHALPLRRHAQSAGGRQPRALHRTSMPDRHCPKGAAAADGTRQQQLNMRRNGLKYNAGPPTPPTRCHWYWHARKAHGVVFIKASGNDMAGTVVDSPMQAWGRQCMTRWAPSAGLPQRRMHCAVRRLRASHRPVRLRGRWAHTCYYKRLLTHNKIESSLWR